MIAAYNLTCPQGHLFWAPTPDFWHGKQCAHTRTLDGRTVTCRLNLEANKP